MNNDLISREALKEELAKCGYDIADFGGLFFIIDNAPKVEPKQGEWIKLWSTFECPFCGKRVAGTDLNFCCKCGAICGKAV